jgi:hypothetical protein
MSNTTTTAAESEVQATPFVQRKSYGEGWKAGYSMKHVRNPYHASKEALNHFTWASGQESGYSDAVEERD